MAALFANFNEAKATSQIADTDKTGEDVAIDVGEMSRDGKLAIDFNQPLMVPPFSTPTDSDEERGRALVSVQELNVTRDIMNIEYVSEQSDANPEDLGYDIFISKWDENGIEVQFNFTNPLAVSKGRGQDKVLVAIKNPGLFASKKSGKIIQAD